MKEEVLVIDGYNLMHAWEKEIKTGPAELEHARIRLIEQLANYGAYQDKRIIIVFDGKGTGSKKKHQVKNLEVVFTRENQTADSFIEILVGELVRDYQVSVVTSDYEEQKSIFGSGASRCSSREFALLIKDSKIKERRHYRDGKVQSNYLDDRIDRKLLETLEKLRKA